MFVPDRHAPHRPRGGDREPASFSDPQGSRPLAGADEVNRDYYATLPPGREDYWRKMAAPRFRVRTFLRLLDLEPPRALVDLGCGNGQLLGRFQERYPGARLAGIDLSAAQIEANRAKHSGIDWHVADLQRAGVLPAEIIGQFDAVVASEIIEHVADPETFLRNALQLASPGSGRLLLSTQSGTIHETERRVGHHRHFDRIEMEHLITKTGWSAVRVWNYGFPFHDLSKWWANRNPDANLARFAERGYGPLENGLCLALRFAFLFNSRRRGAQLFTIARRPGSS